MGIQIFESERERLIAGYILESPVPDSEGFPQARIETDAGRAKHSSACRYRKRSMRLCSDFSESNVDRPGSGNAFDRDVTHLSRVLRATKLFAGLADATVEKCAEHFTFVRGRRHETLFRQGDPCTLVYCVISGLVHLARLTEDGCEFTTRVACSGDIFGDESLSDGPLHSRSATPLEDCILAVCPADYLKALVMRHPQLGLNIARILQERHENALVRIQRMTFNRARDHLLALLHELAADCGVNEPHGMRIEASLTQTQLASLIGTTRETVSYELRALEDEGYVLRQGRKIVIPSSPLTAA
jgi:CRP-like cAMP-binding protein